MQRTDTEGIIISCDFCGTDWDPNDWEYTNPMSEGHQGSVICLSCLQKALVEMTGSTTPYACTLCRLEEMSLPRWKGKRPQATACRDCIHQAAGIFSKDEDVKWKWKRPD